MLRYPDGVLCPNTLHLLLPNLDPQQVDLLENFGLEPQPCLRIVVAVLKNTTIAVHNQPQ